MRKIFFAFLIMIVFAGSAFSETPEYNLSQMKQMNPDFSTYPNEAGLIWRKHVVFSRSEDGGLEVTRLYVILGREGLNERWLSWNIPTPNRGRIEILEADIYDYDKLLKLSSITPDENISAGITKLNFSGVSDKFIIVLSWKEILPEQLTFEGYSDFQEDLRVWESITEIYSPQELSYKTFPEQNSPEIEELDSEILYRWRNINADPYSSSGLVKNHKSGVIFSARNENSNLIPIVKEAENFNSDVNIKHDMKGGAAKFLSWLEKQPEIILAEGTPRKIPSDFPLSKREKLIFAKQVLSTNKINANLAWRIPFDPDEKTPLCPAMLWARNPVLDIQGVKGLNYVDFNSDETLAGAKIFTLNKENKLISRKIPLSKSSDNRLIANMNLKLDENGSLNGIVKIIPHGEWKNLNLDVLTLFPDLTNYNNVKYKESEISFNVENKPGVAGTGHGILAIIPFFEPVMVRKLGDYEDGVELNFPFIMEQNINLEFPKGAKEALISGKVAKNPDKINYSHYYRSKKHSLTAQARFELNMPNVSSGNVGLLRRYLDQWRIFSSKAIPVR
ncbi:MAG: hypothetical protein IJQ99_05725 [Synergistaceae bacterium]|nr:hypothetical protein [Synergistaceae bacterium]